VFAANGCIRGTTKDPTAAGRLGEPIRLGDVTVRSGDAVLGDNDGVVVVDAAAVDAVAAAASERVAAEREVVRRLRAGESTLEILGLAG
jgi:4-hydroxy-4-methyl-2-oxoglutarate aldolase